jgi:hypothetical protein
MLGNCNFSAENEQPGFFDFFGESICQAGEGFDAIACLICL